MPSPKMIVDRRTGALVRAASAACPGCAGRRCQACGGRGILWLSPDGRTALRKYGRAGVGERLVRDG